ncbi:lactococcin 972 family bacteriocin [Bacillus atrophaeus]|uniref:lactococcin 972 family bacteriocin n=1 Tax=Bacillus sp. HU-1818 TaxID=2704469 RepID=UPI001F5CB1EE|nr:MULTISPECIES: lactococcin 972 family bacteriocin [Bacillus]MCI3196894.1 lactococcin 972 family bacteriocin [Bacillus sp. HU-1818]MDQ0927823.1 lactococcin 972 family bacteriocin [Bacillus atrophaeus]
MKKKVLAPIVLGIALLGGQAAFASPSDDVNHGEINLDESRDLMHAMKLTKTKAGGGTWYHGFEGGFVKSNYNHTKKTHKSSAAAGQRFFESKWKKKNEGYTYASVAETFFGNKAFWNTK